jgi:Xaa-Pro aminopeptidase
MSKFKEDLRLKRCREQMDDKGISAFFIPRSDEYQGEYVAAYGERLNWIFGFSGSAGLGVVTKNEAAIFVDGRYTLQAQAEVDTSAVEIHNLDPAVIASWVSGKVDGGRIGYDPWVMTPSQVQQYISRGLVMEPVENIVDLAWEDQPDHPDYSVFEHDVQYAGESSEVKCAQISSALKNDNIDAAVIALPENVCWLLNVRGQDVPCTPFVLSRAILRNDGTVIWFVKASRVEGIVLPGHVKQKEPDQFLEVLSSFKEQSILVDGTTAPVAVVHHLESIGAQVVLRQDPCMIAKACKNKVEQNGARQAHQRDGVALTRFLYWLHQEVPKGNVDEISAAGKLLSLRQEQDLFQGPSFDTISGYESNGAIVHYRVNAETNRILGQESLYLVDSGGQYLDGTTDVTRTCCFGDPTNEQRDRFTRVLKGHIALGMSRFPMGTTGGHLDVLARQFLWMDGVDYAHGTGHGVGSFLSVHEGPQNISPRGFHTPFQAGMIVSNEPGYYKNGSFGIRIENLVLVKGDTRKGDEKPMMSFETLTLAPIQLNLIKKDLMTQLEIDWLNAYHKRIFETLSPCLNQDEKAWLKDSTAAL